MKAHLGRTIHHIRKRSPGVLTNIPKNVQKNILRKILIEKHIQNEARRRMATGHRVKRVILLPMTNHHGHRREDPENQIHIGPDIHGLHESPEHPRDHPNEIKCQIPHLICK